MDKLYPILTQMKTSLDELEAIMIEEVNQLNRAQINPVSLQVLADNKNQLLTTLQYYDDMRRQQEQSCGTEAPYPGLGKLFASWQQVHEKVRSTKALNQKVESLLQSHIKKNQHIQKVIDHVGNTNSLYGPAGESSIVATGRKYNISI
ncbi:MAG: flagellar export chaperone FlgN [Enterobacter cloacae]|nr:flagellar export chaperone FlgN [Enterobacter cloacae]MDU2520556.1 flagellar export chaperone FlgN [Enterobacter cloacae]MDU2666476.1 flagellar export chaperone FlgN [Enterobacter cloacae]